MKFISLFLFASLLSFAVFADTVNVTVRAVGNGKISVNGANFETEKIIQVESGSTIQVNIDSMDNFVGWGGFGNASERSITSSKTITVGSSDMTITAYFLNNIKDNIILNGDLEINNNHANNQYIVTDVSRLTAGTWKIINNANSGYYRCGINSANNGTTVTFATNTKAYTIGGLSFQLASDVNTKTEGCWMCEVNAPCGGLYTFSLVLARCNRDSFIGANYWKLKVELIDNCGNITQAGFFDVSGSKAKWLGPYTSDEFKLSKGGVYTLKLSIPIESRYNASKRYLIMCMDDLELKLTKQLGFFIKVR
jgi:hypothetical protein